MTTEKTMMEARRALVAQLVPLKEPEDLADGLIGALLEAGGDLRIPDRAAALARGVVEFQVHGIAGSGPDIAQAAADWLARAQRSLAGGVGG
ncbi:hypothetical protein [Ruegeria sp.]|uniref:hypothetical protein n=1 Tax=Ruegeria sp. TaxID=1879320 RepID=UPI003B5C3DDB